MDIVSFPLSSCSVDIHPGGFCWTRAGPPNTPNQWNTEPTMNPSMHCSRALPLTPLLVVPDSWPMFCRQSPPSPHLLSTFCFLWVWYFKRDDREENTIGKGGRSHCANNQHMKIMEPFCFLDAINLISLRSIICSGQRPSKDSSWKKYKCLIKIWGKSHLMSNYRNTSWNTDALYSPLILVNT